MMKERARAADAVAVRSRIRVGVSGWRYAGWRGKFYPPRLVQRAELAFAAERFDSIELNGSFFWWRRRESYGTWYAEVPGAFTLAVKAGRFIPHMLKLRNVETARANFFPSGVPALEKNLGPILGQFPPQLGFDGRFE